MAEILFIHLVMAAIFPFIIGWEIGQHRAHKVCFRDVELIDGDTGSFDK